MKKIFKIPDKLIPSFDLSGSIIGLHFDANDLYNHYFEFEFLRFIEDKYDCSGMCKPALFYFSSNINSYVKPEKACLEEIRYHVVENTKSYSVMSLLIGMLALVLFIMHLFLYGKNDNLNKNESGVKFNFDTKLQEVELGELKD